MTGDRGSATVLAVVVAAGLAIVAAVVLTVGAAVIARHRVSAAADLAALAAAAAAQSGTAPSGTVQPVPAQSGTALSGTAGADDGSACADARWVTAEMGVRLDSCRFDGADALVEVSAGLGGPLAGYGRVRARARAGPVRSGPTAGPNPSAGWRPPGGR